MMAHKRHGCYCLAILGILLMAPSLTAQNKNTAPQGSPETKTPEEKSANVAEPSVDKNLAKKEVPAPATDNASVEPTTEKPTPTEDAANKASPEAPEPASGDNENTEPPEPSPVGDENNNAKDTADDDNGATETDDNNAPETDATDKPNPTIVVKKKTVQINTASSDAEKEGLTDKQKAEEQKRHMFVVSYNMAQPRGNTSKFVDKFSFEGFGFEYRFFLRKQLSLGLTFSWNTFERKETGLFNLDTTTAIEGTRIKIIDLVQLAPTVQYHFKRQSAAAVPFLGLNIGPYFTSQIVDWGWWYQRVSSWQFGFTPELGLRLTRLPIPLYVSVRYTYAAKANDIDAQQTLGFNVGIAFLK